MELPRCKRCQKKDIACGYPNSRASLSHTLIPDLDFPWLDDMMQNSNVLPWTGVLQPQLQATPEVVAFARSLGSQETCAPYDDIPEYLIATESPTRTTLARAETEAALHRFKTWPDKWLKEGKAPFIHPKLYASSMPKSLQDAYAACAIYSTKTPDNSFIAFTGMHNCLIFKLMFDVGFDSHYDDRISTMATLKRVPSMAKRTKSNSSSGSVGVFDSTFQGSTDPFGT
jgi:hypothetical protein